MHGPRARAITDAQRRFRTLKAHHDALFSSQFAAGYRLEISDLLNDRAPPDNPPRSRPQRAIEQRCTIRRIFEGANRLVLLLPPGLWRLQRRQG